MFTNLRFFPALSALFAFGCTCLVASGAVLAQTAPPATGATPTAPRAQVVGRASWDNNYLFLTLQVDDVNLQGVNAAPMSQPQADDSVAVYLDFGTTGMLGAQSHAMLVSAAGGFTFLRGAADGKSFEPRPLFSIKYAVTLQGTLNRPDDRDRGYTVELAIPWAGLEIKPEDIKAGFAFRYTVVARGRGGSLSSLGSRVGSEADVLDPAKWMQLTLGAPGAAPKGNGDIAYGLPPGGAPPLIDGLLRASEWPELSRFAFAAPAQDTGGKIVVPAPTITAVRDNQLPALQLNENLRQISPRIFARYRIDFQADPRKSVPFRGILNIQTKQFLLIDQPVAGIGPWFSADRVGWHRAQLAEMRRTGVDVALVEISALTADIDGPGDKALLTLAAALRDMRNEGQAAPTVALSLDLSPLASPAERRLNLATVEGRTQLYRNIARFMRLIAPELRTEVQLPSENGGGIVCPVFLSGAQACSNWDYRLDGRDWVTDLRARFAAEFAPNALGNVTLVFVGDVSFADQSDRFAGILPAKPNAVGTGFLPIGVVAPGMIRGKSVLPRRDGATFREGWELVASSPWVLIDSWNDFERASEVAASRQYGNRYLDQTRIQIAQRYQSQPRRIKWLAHTAPTQFVLGQPAQVDVTLQNIGSTPLRGDGPPAQATAMSYRWLQGGKVVGAMFAPRPLRSAFFPGDVITLAVPVLPATTDPTGRVLPLPPGDYLLQMDMLQGRTPTEPGRYFSDDMLPSLSIPVKIVAERADSVEWNGSSNSTLLLSGGYFPMLLRARWQGKEPLPASSTSLTYQVLSENGAETIASGSFPLTTDLVPGVWSVLRAPIRLNDSGGAALAGAAPEAVNRNETGGYYRVRWLLTRTGSTDPILGEYTDTIAVYPGDDEARVLPPKNKIEPISGGGRTTVAVTVINRGFNRWPKGTAFVGYHWYYADGAEAQWKPALPAKIEQDVDPGKSVTVNVPIVAPDRPGAYIVTFDVTRNGPDNYLSTRPVTRIGDIAVVGIRVIDGRLRFMDLRKLYDTDAVAGEDRPADGDFNGVGSTFPAEFFVPDRFGPNASEVRVETSKDSNGKIKTKSTMIAPPPYPSGYFSEVSAARQVSFVYGSTSDGARNAISCRGQVIPVEGGRFVGLNIAACAIGGEDRSVNITLRYKDKTTQEVITTVGDWGRASRNTEPGAISCPIRRTPSGDVVVPSTVYHLILPVNIGKDLVGITLPNDPKIKVFAVTLER